MNQNHTKSFSEWLETLLTAFFPRLDLLLFVPILCGVCTAMVCLSLPPVYQGTFSLLIKAPEIDKTGYESDMNVALRPGIITKNVVSDEVYLLQSHTLYENVAQTIKDKNALKSDYWETALPGWLFTYIFKSKTRIKEQLQSFIKGKDDDGKKSDADSLEKSALRIKKLCETEPLRGSDIIEVRCKHHTPQLIEEILIAYEKEYQSIKNNIWFNKNTPNLFQKHSEDYFIKWQEMLEEVMELKSDTDLIDPFHEKAELQKQLIKYRAEVSNLKTTLKELKEHAKIVKSLQPEDTVTFITEGIEGDNLFRELKIKIGSVTAERSRLLRDFQPEASSVAKLDYQMEELYVKYKKLIQGVSKQEMKKNRIRTKALSSAIKENEVRLSELNERVTELEKNKYQIKMLEGKIERYGKQYNEYETRAMKINLQEELRKTATTVRVIAPPFVSQKPVFPPNPIFLAVLAMLMGFLLTVFFIIVMQLMDDSFHTPEEVSQELNLPVLASFPVRRWRKLKKQKVKKGKQVKGEQVKGEQVKG